MKEGENRPASEVFLTLWRWRTTHDPEATPADFALCAEAWAEIRRMEALNLTWCLHPWYRPELIEPVPENGPIRTPEEDPSPAAQDDKGEAAQADKTDEETEKWLADRQEKAKAGAAKALASRKRTCKETLEALRADGASLQDIADADQLLTLEKVLAFLSAQPVSVATLAALERAAAALKARRAGPAEEDDA